MNLLLKLLRKDLLVLSVLLLSFSLNLISQNQRVFINSQSLHSNNIELVSDNNNQIILRFELNYFDLNKAVTSKGTAYSLSNPKAPNILKQGYPDIFYLTSSVIIPDIGNMEIKVIPGDYKEIENIDILPSKGNLTRDIDPNEVEYKWGDTYSKDLFFPEKPASIRTPYILRDFRGLSVDVFPVQYNPVSKTLRYYSEITVILTHKESKGANELLRRDEQIRIEKEFSSIYSNFFLNYSTSKYPILEEEGELLIIAYDEFVESMLPFVNWKRSIGRKTTMVSKSEVGSTSAQIKNFIVDYYNSSESNLAYVLIVGDAAQVPPAIIAGSGHSDNYYGYILGDDAYNDIFIGRFSAETTGQVETHVQRMIEYERDLNTDDNWLSVGMGIARNEGTGNGHNGESDYLHIDYIRDTLLNYNYVEVYREYDGNAPDLPNTTSAKITSIINEGVGIINYCNHGSVTGWSVANYSINHVNTLTNTGRLPFIWAVACVNGDFVSNFCFAEAWLRATHNGQPAGAIGVMMSTINQPWQPPMTGQDEMVGILSESFTNNIKRTFGGISINGSMKMLDIHGASGKKTHDTWLLFGDPTLMLRTDTPKVMIISYEPTIIIGSTSFVVNCDTDGALVAVSYTDELDEVHLLATATVNEGVASIELLEPVDITTHLNVVVTSYNGVTHLGVVNTVPPEEPYVTIKSFITSNPPDFDSVIGLDITFQNISMEPYVAQNVIATISSNSPYVSILQNQVELGDILPDQEASFANAFQILISNDIPDQTELEFNIMMSGKYGDNDYSWSKTITFKANAPEFSLANVTVNDEGQGIPTILDPGETAILILELANKGHATSPSSIVSLTSQTEFASINGESEISVGVIGGGESIDIEFSITIAEETPIGSILSFILSLEGGEYSMTKEIDFKVGFIPEYPIENAIVSGCIGKFFDSGSNHSNYSNEENFTMTFYPKGENTTLVFVFDSFEIENAYDFLYIYDGEDTSAPQIPGSPFTGDNSPREFMATNEQGAITFNFISDAYINDKGWEAQFFCVNLSAPPGCSSNPFPIIDDNIEVSPLKLSWNFVPGAFEYDVFWGEGNLPDQPNFITQTINATIDVNPHQNYVWKVVPKNNVGEAEGCPIWNFKTSEITQHINMHTGSVFTCNAKFFDSGGEEGEYVNNESNTLTVYPDNEEHRLSIEFIEFNVEQNWDFLKIYDGTSTSANLLANLTGTNRPEKIKASNPEGALTFRFTSDGYGTRQGWVALFACHKTSCNVNFLLKNNQNQSIVGAQITLDGYGSQSTNSTGEAHFEKVSIGSTIPYSIEHNDFHTFEGELAIQDDDMEVEISMIALSSSVIKLNELSVYPNPFDNYIEIEGIKKISNIRLYSILGKQIEIEWGRVSLPFTLGTDQLNPGFYLLLLQFEDYELITVKLIKK